MSVSHHHQNHHNHNTTDSFSSSSKRQASSLSSSSSSHRGRLFLGRQVWDSIRNVTGGGGGGGGATATTTTTTNGSGGGNSNSNSNSTKVIVGTQALALQRLQKNTNSFSYPKEGFETPMEYSLLYSMICEPKIYPEQVVIEHIQQEDFNMYLQVNSSETTTRTTTTSTFHSDNNNTTTTTTTLNEDRVSYAQLSALLATCAEKFPDNTSRNNHNTSSSSSRRRNTWKDDDDHDDTDNSIHSNPSTIKPVPQALCKAILSCVTKYADDHNLDRATEVQELLQPVEQYIMNQTTHSLLPIYIAYSVGLFIPGGVGVGLTLMSLSAMIAASDKADKHAQTVQTMNSQRHRVADMETTGLLDEV